MKKFRKKFKRYVKKHSKIIHLELMLAFTTLGILIFFIGFHNIDLSMHYYATQTSNIYQEQNGLGWVSDVNGVYSDGINEIFYGFFLFGLGFMYSFVSTPKAGG